jgi:hypothetical protein
MKNVNNDHLKKSAKREMPMLRQELQNLKTCQFAFLTTSFTITGLLLSLLFKDELNKISCLVFLIPLVIILPCFCFFFDKAGTITRIVGYFRILEDIVSYPDFPGWENALSKSREQIKLRNHNTFYIFLRIISMRKPNGYWSLAFNTFVMLIFLCMVSAWFLFLSSEKTILHWIIISLVSVFVIIISIRNFLVIKDLTIGISSYDNNYKSWKDLLKNQDKDLTSQQPGPLN